MSDNELDKLFKEAAEGFTPPQDASAWEQMAGMLDKTPGVTAGFWNWKTISGLTAIGLISVTTIWFATTDNKTSKTISKTNEQHGANNATQGVVQEQKEQTNPTGEENLESAQSVEDQSSGTRTVVSTDQSNSKKRINRTLPTNSSGESDTGFSTLKDERHNPEPSISSVTNDEIKTETNAQVLKDDSENGRLSSLSKREDNSVIAADSVKPIVQKATKIDSISEIIEVSNKKDDKPKARGALSLKAVVSPDFSSVNYFSAGKTGINYGLLVGYSFNNRWSVYTGVISSKKLYQTESAEGSYTSSPGHDYPIKELDGDCRILDIPINVYYSFFPERSFSLRVGLGFSSYIMRKEDYVYCVDYYGTDEYYTQKVRGENNEWFKVMNFSVVASRKLSNRFSAEFEPFVKAPLAGVGEGKVSLVSMGAFINLKYDLIIFK